jgi:hypothetical protein
MNLPHSGMLNLSRIGSLPYGGGAAANPLDNLQSYKSGFYDMQDLIQQLNMGSGGANE